MSPALARALLVDIAWELEHEGRLAEAEIARAAVNCFRSGHSICPSKNRIAPLHGPVMLADKGWRHAADDAGAGLGDAAGPGARLRQRIFLRRSRSAEFRSPDGGGCACRHRGGDSVGRGLLARPALSQRCEDLVRAAG